MLHNSILYTSGTEPIKESSKNQRTLTNRDERCGCILHLYIGYFSHCASSLVVHVHSFHSTLTTSNTHNTLVTFVSTHACLYHVSSLRAYEPSPPSLPPSTHPPHTHKRELELDCPANPAHTARIFSLDCYAWRGPIYSDLRYLMLNELGRARISCTCHSGV